MGLLDFAQYEVSTTLLAVSYGASLGLQRHPHGRSGGAAIASVDSRTARPSPATLCQTLPYCQKWQRYVANRSSVPTTKIRKSLYLLNKHLLGEIGTESALD